MRIKRIPIKVAKEISKNYGVDEVVIFARDPESGRQHVVTFGRTLKQCEAAAGYGNNLKRALGWPEKDCQAKPARSKKKEKL